MGEVPIYTTKAHVFVIDPVTKKSWIPSSSSSVPVNFFFDSSRQSYRIISVDDAKAIINSTVTKDMSFTKTSAKFGQWADLRANTVYGLGFSSDLMLTQFSEQFEEIRDRARQLKEQNESKTNGNDTVKESSIKNNGKRDEAALSQEGEEELLSSASDDSRSTAQSVNELKSIRFQNDRLKLALAQSTANSKKWETELQALKNTNSRLTTALQESMSNVDQWHRQLNMCKEENEKLKKRVNDMEMESSKGVQLSDQLGELKSELERLQNENTEKSQEVNMLQQRVGILNVIEKQHNECAPRLKKAYDENFQLKDRVNVTEEKLMSLSRDKNRNQVEAQSLLSQIAGHLTDITEVTQKLQSSL